MLGASSEGVESGSAAARKFDSLTMLERSKTERVLWPVMVVIATRVGMTARTMLRTAVRRKSWRKTASQAPKWILGPTIGSQGQSGRRRGVAMRDVALQPQPGSGMRRTAPDVPQDSP